MGRPWLSFAGNFRVCGNDDNTYSMDIGDETWPSGSACSICWMLRESERRQKRWPCLYPIGRVANDVTSAFSKTRHLLSCVLSWPIVAYSILELTGLPHNGKIGFWGHLMKHLSTHVGGDLGPVQTWNGEIVPATPGQDDKTFRVSELVVKTEASWITERVEKRALGHC